MMKKRNILLAFLGTATLVALSACGDSAAKETETNEVNAYPLVSVVAAKVDDFEHKLTLQGNVETDQDVMISAEMGGLLTSIAVKEGQQVSKGQTLAIIDGSILASNIQEIQAQLDMAEYMLSKQEELKKRGLGSEVELESARNQVKSLKARMNSVATQKGKTIVRAPFSGTIDKVFASTGEMAAPGAPMMRLVNNAQVDIVADVSERHFLKLKKGTPVELKLPNYGDTSILLSLTNVGNYIEPTNRTFRVMTEIKNNKIFLPNMLVEMHITDTKMKDVLCIPSKSVMKSQDSRDFVFVAKGSPEKMTVHQTFVEVVNSYAGVAVVKPGKGVSEGDWIVVDGNRGVADKDVVRSK